MAEPGVFAKCYSLGPELEQHWICQRGTLGQAQPTDAPRNDGDLLPGSV